MIQHKVRALPYYYKNQLELGARGLIVNLMRQCAEAEDVVNAVMYDMQQLQSVVEMRDREIESVVKMRDREIECLKAQVTALQRILREKEAAGG
jgi:2-keto-3-deoxy-L-rhamnonate aldolase RhmA